MSFLDFYLQPFLSLGLLLGLLLVLILWFQLRFRTLRWITYQLELVHLLAALKYFTQAETLWHAWPVIIVCFSALFTYALGSTAYSEGKVDVHRDVYKRHAKLIRKLTGGSFHLMVASNRHSTYSGDEAEVHQLVFFHEMIDEARKIHNVGILHLHIILKKNGDEHVVFTFEQYKGVEHLYQAFLEMSSINDLYPNAHWHIQLPLSDRPDCRSYEYWRTLFSSMVGEMYVSTIQALISVALIVEVINGTVEQSQDNGQEPSENYDIDLTATSTE